MIDIAKPSTDHPIAVMRAWAWEKRLRMAQHLCEYAANETSRRIASNLVRSWFQHCGCDCLEDGDVAEAAAAIAEEGLQSKYPVAYYNVVTCAAHGSSDPCAFFISGGGLWRRSRYGWVKTTNSG